MKTDVILLGATGMVGMGVLLECLDHPDIGRVLAVGRRSCGVTHDKLEEIIHHDFLDYSEIEDRFDGFQACFYCLGVSYASVTKEAYHTITHEYTVKLAEALCRRNRDMTFCYVSGSGSDDTLKSRMTWARIKGETENSLKKFPFKNLYLFRPAYIQPMRGIKPSYAMYTVFGPLFPLLKFLFPRYVTTTTEVGHAMIAAALHGADSMTLENADIVRLAGRE
jgi:hypothetical protein